MSDTSVQRSSSVERLLAWGAAWDQRLLEAAYFRRGSRASAFLMWLVAKSGDGPLYAAICLVLLLLDAPGAGTLWRCAWIAFAFERALYFGLKYGIRRARPYNKLPHIRRSITPLDQYSFPSGHSAAACVMATLLSSVYPAVTLPGYLWAVSVAYSRVYHGIHFPVDVVCGLLLGFGCGWLGIWLGA